ncbi:unnamed protein product [Effrenium voratum]|uniref:Uncharacterized protein n=1 Tax=Effrenium voratum TaxID=2562239 RepID=A0AA36J747_9DINO|nr:unnamed protein product [Effrenium voratum]
MRQAASGFSRQSFVSKSREVDTVVTALHRNMDVLKKQKSMVVESMKGLYKTVNEVTAAVAQEQSLIVKQREIIQQLHSQVRSLQEEVQRSTSTLPRHEEREEELAAEREQCAQQLQALVLSSEGNQSFVSKSREVDTVVTALHRNMDVLKKQKSMVVESMKGLYKTVNEVTAAVAQEQSLIVKQREIIQQLHSQVRSLQEEVQRSTSTLPRNEEREEELAAEREQCAQQLQAFVVSSSEGNQSFVSKSREVDTVVTALHRNMDVLKKQKSMVVESMKGLYKTVNEVTAAVAQASDLVAAGDFHGACEVLGNVGTLEESSAWAPGILELRQKLQMMLALAGASQQA